MASFVNVRLEDSHISVSLRLPVHTNETKRNASNKPTEHAPIIVRFSNRDKRNELYQKRKLIKPSPDSSKDSFEDNGLIRIRENLTPFKKNLYNQAKKRKQCHEASIRGRTKLQISLDIKWKNTTTTKLSK